MDPKDDPEARIRALEQPLVDAARTSELGTGPDTRHLTPPPTQPWTNTFPPPPPHAPPAPWPDYVEPYPEPPQHRRRSYGPWILIAVTVAAGAMLTASVAAYLLFSTGDTRGTDPSTRPTVQTPTALPPSIPLMPSETESNVAPGETVIVSGIGENRTIECNGNAVTVSGIENTVDITGHCAGLTVSGIQNVVTVASADTIDISGFTTRVPFHSGQPEVTNSGQDNTVGQG